MSGKENSPSSERAKTFRKIATDVYIRRHDSLFLFYVWSPSAKRWLIAHTRDEAQWFAGTLVVEHRYAADLAQALIDAGFIVR